jgi:DNA-binding beta-propeller fold protein YncE
LVAGALAVAGITAVLAWAAGPAHAVAPVQVGSFGFVGNPAGLAVEPSSGMIYVADASSDSVLKFDLAAADPSTPVLSFGSPGAGAGQFNGPQGIAVDQLSGSVYVVDGGNRRVQKFDSLGNFVTAFGVPGTGDGQFSPWSSGSFVAVDAAGHVFVGDGSANRRIQEFDSTGAYVGQLDLSAVNVNGGVSGLAIDPAGRFYDVDGETITRQLSPAGDAQDPPVDLDTGGAPRAVAIDPVSGDAYIWDANASHVFRFDATGAFQEAFAAGEIAATRGIGFSDAGAFGATGGVLYVADGGCSCIRAYGTPAAVAPTLDDQGNTTNVGLSSATLNATVNPNGAETSYRFEYGLTDSYGSSIPVPDGTLAAGYAGQPVSADLVSLDPDTTYHYRIVATNSEGTVEGPDRTFATIPEPTITRLAAADIGQDQATLTADVVPKGDTAHAYFEYGPTDSYGTQVPLPPGEDMGAGADDPATGAIEGVATLTRQITGLDPQTTYHYRVVATNGAGTATSQDRTFTTRRPPAAIPESDIPGKGFLPDDRAWEQVSPTDKNGGDVLTASYHTRAAADGSAVSFSSLVGFGDVRGTTYSTAYMSRRGSQGWATHGITPRQEPMSTLLTLDGPGDAVFEGEFSDDLSRGIVRANAFPQGDTNVAGVSNLFMRDDLLTAGPGSWHLLTGSVVPVAPSNPLGGAPPAWYKPFSSAASADFSHVIFQSSLNLTQEAIDADLPAEDDGTDQKLYEWVDGQVRLVGVLPDGSLAPRSVAGGWLDALAVGYMHDAISDDGSRIIFTVPDPSVGKHHEGKLYMRIDGATTIHINASEKPVPDAPQPATFEAANPDASKVFFQTTEQLVEEDDNPGVDLYRYDVDAQPGERLTRISIPNLSPDVDGGLIEANQAIVGVSDDGGQVVFTYQGPLGAGEPSTSGQAKNLYMWRDGAISYVGQFADSLELRKAAGALGWLIAPISARVTPDGRSVAFVTSQAQQTATGLADHGDCKGQPCSQVYVFDADANGGAGRLRCASCDPSGAATNGHGAFDIWRGTGGTRKTSHITNPLSSDGRWLFFHTPRSLVSEDRNSSSDVYEFEIATGEVRLLSSGNPGAGDAFFLDASADGEDVFFATREQLVGWDTDGSYDLYDARVGGGLAEPVAPLAACEGDACQGPATGGPALESPASDGVSGAGDLSGVRARASLRVPGRAARRALARRGRMPVIVAVNRAGLVSVTLRARIDGRRTVVGRASKRARRAGRLRLSVALSRSARRELAGRGRLGVSLGMAFSGQRGRQTLRFTLRNPSAAGRTATVPAHADRKGR